jgi:ABC-2 type transport system permease protein
MKAFSIAVKTSREIGRDRRTLGFLLAFPVIFVVVFGIATFETGELTGPHALAIINEDQGAFVMNNTTPEFYNFGEGFAGVLRNATYENSTTHVFIVHDLDRPQAEEWLASRSISAIVTIPANFSAGVRAVINQTIAQTVSTAILRAASDGNLTPEAAAAISNYTLPEVEANVTATVVVEGDFTYSEFAATQAYVQGFVDGYVTQVARTTVDAVFDFLPEELRREAPQGPFVDARTRGVEGTETFSVFDWMAPGLFVFATLLIALGVASAVARETEGGNIERLKVSRMSTLDLLAGMLLPWTALGAVQVLLLFGTAVAMGFEWQGGLAALGAAVGVGTLSATAAVALGLLLSAAVKTERQATSIGPLVVVPLAFLTEAFFPIAFRAMVEGSPWGLAVRTLREVLTYGGDLEGAAAPVAMMGLQAALLFTVATVAFRRARLVPE